MSLLLYSKSFPSGSVHKFQVHRVFLGGRDPEISLVRSFPPLFEFPRVTKKGPLNPNKGSFEERRNRS